MAKAASPSGCMRPWSIATIGLSSPRLNAATVSSLSHWRTASASSAPAAGLLEKVPSWISSIRAGWPPTSTRSRADSPASEDTESGCGPAACCACLPVSIRRSSLLPKIPSVVPPRGSLLSPVCHGPSANVDRRWLSIPTPTCLPLIITASSQYATKDSRIEPPPGRGDRVNSLCRGLPNVNAIGSRRATTTAVEALIGIYARPEFRDARRAPSGCPHYAGGRGSSTVRVPGAAVSCGTDIRSWPIRQVRVPTLQTLTNHRTSARHNVSPEGGGVMATHQPIDKEAVHGGLANASSAASS